MQQEEQGRKAGHYITGTTMRGSNVSMKERTGEGMVHSFATLELCLCTLDWE